jgi:methylglutamate dehydrogenase subunit D
VADFSLFRRSGLEHLLQPGAYGAHAGEPGIVAVLHTDLALAYVLAHNGKTDALRHRVQERLGLRLPMAAQQTENSSNLGLDSLNFIWAGPGRWLARTSAQTGASLEAMLRGELSGVASVINQTDGRCVFRISGANLREVLAKGLPIDLDPRAFGPGDTALSLIGHINVHFWQVDRAPTYDFAVPRSFAASFCEWLFAAAASHGLAFRAADAAAPIGQTR